MPTCTAMKGNGQICGKNCNADGRWCGIHANQARRIGEAEMRNIAERAEVERRFRQLGNRNAAFWRLDDILSVTTRYTLGAVPGTVEVAAGIPEPFHAYFTELFPRINTLFEDILNGVEGTPERITALVADIRRNAPRRPEPNRVAQRVPQNRHAPIAVGELGQFARDTQNVHTTVMVDQTKHTIERVLKIAVPAEYSYKNGHKTLAEILLDVPMSDKATGWFVDKYLKHDTIYGYQKGIFAKVTDSVWQYIRNSPDKTDLCKIMATELQDNVGMCQQGNLTRMCNVLAGYLEGLNTESQGEQLQRRMAELMNTLNEAERVQQGKNILQELAVPDTEWAPWLEALS